MRSAGNAVRKCQLMAEYNIKLLTRDRVWDTLFVEVKDEASLRIEVASFIGELLKDDAEQFWMDEEWRVDVTDITGLIIFRMELSVAIAPAAAPVRRGKWNDSEAFQSALPDFAELTSVSA